MKKMLLSLLTLLASVSLMAQTHLLVHVETEVEGNDTLRTFYIDDKHCDKLIQEFSVLYGTPAGVGTGSIQWSGVEVPGVGSNLNIVCSDGAMIFDGTNWSFSPFINQQDMDAKLSADPSRMRRMYITVKKGSKNTVRTSAQTTQFANLVEEKLLAY